MEQPYRILSFDGGGVHALSYLPIIAHLEEYLGAPVAQSNHFRLLVGTSTGTIAAAALKVGYSAKEVIALYQQYSPEIFTPLAPWNQLFNKYSSSVLRRVLFDFFRHPSTKQPLRWCDFYDREAPNPSTELIVTLWNVSSERTCYLSTNQSRPRQETRLAKALVADIITACCSAPYYFPPRAFHLGTEDVVYCDGGITGLNNPAVYATALAITELRKTHPTTPIQVLSFGSGKNTDQMPIARLATWTALDAILNTIDALMTSSAVLMEDFYRTMGDYLGVQCLRTNQPRARTEQLDDVKGIPKLLSNYIENRIQYQFFAGEDSRGESTLTPREFEEICRGKLCLSGSSVQMPRLTVSAKKQANAPKLLGLAFSRGLSFASFGFRAFLRVPSMLLAACFFLLDFLPGRDRSAPHASSDVFSWEARASWLTNPDLTARVGIAIIVLSGLITSVFVFNRLRIEQEALAEERGKRLEAETELVNERGKLLQYRLAEDNLIRGLSQQQQDWYSAMAAYAASLRSLKIDPSNIPSRHIEPKEPAAYLSALFSLQPRTKQLLVGEENIQRAGFAPFQHHDSPVVFALTGNVALLKSSIW